MASFRLGDSVSKALALVGVTEDRVTRALGRPCRCGERREWLNDLGRRLDVWAARVLGGRTDGAEKYLAEIIEEAPK